MGILSRQPLRRQVLAGAALVLIPFFVVIYFALDRSRTERTTDLTADASALAIAAASSLDTAIADVRIMGRVLATHPALTALESPGAVAQLEAALANQSRASAAALVSMDGTIHAVVGREPAGDRPGAWFERAWLTPSLPDTRLVTVPADASHGPRVVSLSGIRRDGAVVGVLALMVDWVALEPALRRLVPTSGAYLELFDVDQVVARVPAQTWSADDERHAVHGERAAVSAVPWTVSMAFAPSLVEARVRPQRDRNLIIAGLFFACSVGLLLWVTGRMSSNLIRLQHDVARIADGDLTTVIPQDDASSLEVHELRASVMRMAENLSDARTTLDRQLEQERSMNEELQSLQRQVVRQERMAAVGQLAAGLAHELNNPLQAIMGATHHLSRSAILDDDGRGEIETLKAKTEQAVSIIRSLSRFWNHQQVEASLIDLVDVVHDVEQLRRSEPGHLPASLMLSTRGRLVYASYSEMQQVVLNLLTNAEQALASLPVEQARIDVRLSDIGRWIRLEVADNGEGIPPEHEGRLFQPFFTTRPVGHGRGLGLSVSHGIVRSHGGTIGYAPNEWGGASFFVELPCAEGAVTNTDDRTDLLRPSL